MNTVTTKIITTADQALKSITTLQTELRGSTELADRLGFVHSFYIDDRDVDRPLFGFSKWIGYEDLNAETYLQDYKLLDGRNTEWALKGFFEELRPETSGYRHYHDLLAAWLGTFGKTPRKAVRLFVLKNEFKENDQTDTDRRLLDLMIAVSDILSTDQRHELRARL